MNPDNAALQDLLLQGGNSITLNDDGEFIVLLSLTGKPVQLARIAAIPETANGLASTFPPTRWRLLGLP
jgi:hypothetical protein